MENVPMQTLRLIPLEDTVVFPNMDLTLAVDAGDEERVLLVPRHENEFASVGDRADARELVLVAWNQQHPLLVAGVDGEGQVHVREDDRVLEGDQPERLHRYVLHSYLQVVRV